MLCLENNMGTKTREMVGRLVSLQNVGKASCSPLGATNRDANPTIRDTKANSPCNLPLQTQQSRSSYQTVQCTAAVVSSFHPSPLSAPNR